MTATSLDPAAIRAEQVRRMPAKYRQDPLGFVMAAWPWGEKGGPLEHSPGPDANQAKFLEDLGKHVKNRNFDGHTPVAPILMSISSCHGSGKSSLGAMICWWLLITRPYSIGTVTAGTFQQLEDRTWADIMFWGRLCLGSDQFDIQANGIFHKDPTKAEKWKVTPKTAIEARAQTFAGQHAATSSSWFMFDEASEVPDMVFRTCYGGLTDGEPMMFVWGQMLRNSGEFYKVTFGDASDKWDHRVFDGRTSAFTNKTQIDEWIEELGIDDDWVRVRVLGLPPRASELQFIGQGLVDEARKRDHTPLEDEPLVWGFDAANGGLAKHCFAARRGLDGKSIPPILLPGSTERDAVVAKAVDLLRDQSPGRRAAAMFGDQAFGSVILQRVRALGFTNVFEVNFGSPSFDKRQLNIRAMCWFRMREWMRLGSIPDNYKVYQGFLEPGFHDRSGKLVIESKADMAKRRAGQNLHFPDALSCTFYQTIAPPPKAKPEPAYVGTAWS